MRLPSRTGSRWLPLPPRVRVLTPPRVRGLSPPRVRGLTRGFIPPPTSWVRPRVAALHGFADSPLHGFADSPVALFRHPLRGFAWVAFSNSHPDWLNCALVIAASAAREYTSGRQCDLYPPVRSPVGGLRSEMEPRGEGRPYRLRAQVLERPCQAYTRPANTVGDRLEHRRLAR